MKFDIIYPLTASATIRIKLHKSISSALVALYDGERMYFAFSLMPYFGPKTGQPVVAPLPWPVFHLPSCVLQNAVFTMTLASAAEKASIRFQAVLQQDDQPDKAENEIIASW